MTLIYLQQFISNSVLFTALIGWFAAQVLKIIFSWDKKFDFKNSRLGRNAQLARVLCDLS